MHGYKTPHALKIYEKDPELHARLHKALHAPSLYDVAIQALVKKDSPIHKDVLNRDITQPYEEDATVEAGMVGSVCGCEKYWNLYQLAEKLIDIEDWLQQWRFRHMKTSRKNYWT